MPLEIEIERELESHDTQREMMSCTEPEYTCSLIVACTNCNTMKVGTSCMNTAKVSELPWQKDCVEEIQEMAGAKLMSVSQGSCSLPSNEKPTVMVTNCPAIAFTLRVSAKPRLLNKRFSEHLERNEHKSIDDLHEDISCGIRLQHKWSRQQKYFLASVDVKNPHANFNDLENSVPPEESNDDLLDQAWDDHTGEPLDAKNVKEARQLEMKYYDKMHVFDKVPISQCWERTGKAPLKARWVDIDKGTRYRSRLGSQSVQKDQTAMSGLLQLRQMRHCEH